MQISWRHDTTKNDDADELALRTRPLREAWEARGPGLLRGIAKIVAPDFLADQATIVPQLPTPKYDGLPRPSNHSHNTVTIDAVLVNPHPTLPEVVRLGWLLAQLQLPTELAAVETWQRALLPMVLTAAEEVELARCDTATLSLTLQAWLDWKEQPAVEQAELLWQWWQPIRQGELTLAASLAKLAP